MENINVIMSAITLALYIVNLLIFANIQKKVAKLTKHHSVIMNLIADNKL